MNHTRPAFDCAISPRVACEVPSVAVGAAVSRKAPTAMFGACGYGVLRFRFARVAVLGLAGFASERGLVFGIETIFAFPLACEQVAHGVSVEPGLKCCALLGARRSFVACHRALRSSKTGPSANVRSARDSRDGPSNDGKRAPAPWPRAGRRQRAQRRRPRWGIRRRARR